MLATTGVEGPSVSPACSVPGDGADQRVANADIVDWGSGMKLRAALVASIVGGGLAALLLVPVGMDRELNADGSDFVNVYRSILGVDLTPLTVSVSLAASLGVGFLAYAVAIDFLRHRQADA